MESLTVFGYCRTDSILNKLDTLYGNQSFVKPSLKRICDAMGGPGFPDALQGVTFPLDDVHTFYVILNVYLKHGGSVNDTFDFDDGTLHDENLTNCKTGIKNWTLLHAASSVWINAPNCVRLLLTFGADIHAIDSTGRTPMSEAFSTARHYDPLTKRSPQILDIYLPLISKEHVNNARDRDGIEAIFVEFSQFLWSQSTPYHTRIFFTHILSNGFYVHKKKYDSDDLKLYSEKMVVIPYDRFKSHGSIPRSPDINFTVTIETLSCEDKIVFISHRWLGKIKSNPDDSLNSKYQIILDAVDKYCSRHILAHRQCYLWIDFSCIDQNNRAKKGRAVYMIPFYILCCDAIITLDHPEYWDRAWCRIEALFAAESQKHAVWLLFENDDFFPLNNVYPTDVEDPRQGKLSVLADLDYIQSLYWYYSTTFL